MFTFVHLDHNWMSDRSLLIKILENQNHIMSRLDGEISGEDQKILDSLLVRQEEIRKRIEELAAKTHASTGRG